MVGELVGQAMADPGLGGTRNICLIVEYDGTEFCGWQRQQRGRSVQEELERALATLLRETVGVTGAGRTDAGTHALGQVASFRTASSIALARLCAGLNGLLPPDVAVRAARDVPPEFHARFSARSKRYRYRIHVGKAALARRYVWAVPRSLDAAAMRAAAAALRGTHSFGAFCKQDPVPPNLDCRVIDVELVERGCELIFEIEANRFLRHMVRTVVGTLQEIGAHRRPGSDMAALLASGRRDLAGRTAPARGLCLVQVKYPGDERSDAGAAPDGAPG